MRSWPPNVETPIVCRFSGRLVSIAGPHTALTAQGAYRSAIGRTPRFETTRVVCGPADKNATTFSCPAAGENSADTRVMKSITASGDRALFKLSPTRRASCQIDPVSLICTSAEAAPMKTPQAPFSMPANLRKLKGDVIPTISWPDTAIQRAAAAQIMLCTVVLLALHRSMRRAFSSLEKLDLSILGPRFVGRGVAVGRGVVKTGTA